MALLEWTAYNTPDTAVAGASMNALGSSNYALGAAIDNTSALYTDGDLWIALSSAVAAGSGSPSITVWLLPSLDGTNYPTTNGSTTAGAAASNLVAGTILVPPSVNVQYMALRGIPIPPAKFLIQIQQTLGVAFPATNTSVCSLYRYRLQSV